MSCYQYATLSDIVNETLKGDCQCNVGFYYNELTADPLITTHPGS